MGNPQLIMLTRKGAHESSEAECKLAGIVNCGPSRPRWRNTGLSYGPSLGKSEPITVALLRIIGGW